MRYLCVLLALALAAPAWAKPVTVPVGGKSTQLTPQQVQFMRWWRAQTVKTVKPTSTVSKPVATKTLVKVPTKKVTVTVTKVNRPAVKTTTLLVKPQTVVAPTPILRAPALHGQSGAGSLTSLTALLVGQQPGTSTGFVGSRSGQTRTTAEPLRRQGTARVVLEPGSPERQLKSRPASRGPRGALSGQLVIVPTRLSGGEPTPPDTLTTLRYQLELSQME